MLAIYLKEIRSFLSSLIAYVVMLVFLLATGLFTWVLPDYNIFDYGYANLDTLFSMAPWLFMFLISAITMRSLSEEKKNGTIEIITTRPITDLQIILGKYFAGITIVLFTLIPTFIYYITIYRLGAPEGNLDSGAILGSYLGLFFLASCFVAIGMLSSSLSDNQIVSFILSLFLCFLFYNLFDLIADFKLLGSLDALVASLGINAHYQSISRGVVDSRDLLYFLGFDIIFICASKTVFESRKW
jgi:ABC-2 type transport system permease protein